MGYIFRTYIASLIVFLLLAAFPMKTIAADDSLISIKKSKELVVGVDIPYGVMEFYDKSGKAAGIDIDIAHEIASDLGVSVKLISMPFSKLFESLKAEETDVVISAVTITPERQKTMLFSVPYLDAHVSVAVRKDNNTILSLQDLKDKQVGVLKGTVAEGLAGKSEYIDKSLIRLYEKNDQRMADLISKKLDAIIVHFIIKDIPSVKLVGKPLKQSYYGVVSRIDSIELMDEINKTLRKLKRSGKLNQIKQKYIQ